MLKREVQQARRAGSRAVTIRHHSPSATSGPNSAPLSIDACRRAAVGAAAARRSSRRTRCTLIAMST